MKYEDNVLIKLRRDYEKDEVVLFALNKIKELQTELGKANSYIQELEDNLSRKTKEVKLSSDDEVWFKKYSDIKVKVDALLNKNDEKRICSLENRLKKQYDHGRREEQKIGFMIQWINNNAPE